MRITKRVCSLLLALLMMISLLPAPALAEAPETEEPAPVEEPAPADEAAPAEELNPTEEPEAAPAPADEPEVSYSLRGHALTYNERGVYDANLTGGTVTVSASSASSGQTVKC